MESSRSSTFLSGSAMSGLQQQIPRHGAMRSEIRQGVGCGRTEGKVEGGGGGSSRVLSPPQTLTHVSMGMRSAFVAAPRLAVESL